LIPGPPEFAKIVKLVAIFSHIPLREVPDPRFPAIHRRDVRKSNDRPVGTSESPSRNYFPHPFSFVPAGLLVTVPVPGDKSPGYSHTSLPGFSQISPHPTSMPRQWAFMKTARRFIAGKQIE
jgi:hypothetical protein